MGGCFNSKDVIVKKDEIAIQIDEGIKEERKESNEAKILLLGTGDSGKSTFAKQMMILYAGGCKRVEMKEIYLEKIFDNIFVAIQSLVNGVEYLGIEVSADLQADYTLVKESDEWSRDLVEPIERVWRDPPIQEAFRKSDHFQLESNSKYYLDNLREYLREDYELKDEDILKLRMKSSGLVETRFEIDDLKVLLVDVGGQRSERRKWFHCFLDVTAVLYFISLSEYNQTLSEDSRVNRLVETLSLFEEITSSYYFADKDFFIFFNKHDVFQEKILTHPLSELFEDFEGEDTYENSLKYIQMLFQQRFGGIKNPRSLDNYHVFTTCSLNQESLLEITQEIKQIISDKRLQHSNVV